MNEEAAGKNMSRLSREKKGTSRYIAKLATLLKTLSTEKDFYPIQSHEKKGHVQRTRKERERASKVAFSWRE